MKSVSFSREIFPSLLLTLPVSLSCNLSASLSRNPPASLSRNPPVSLSKNLPLCTLTTSFLLQTTCYQLSAHIMLEPASFISQAPCACLPVGLNTSETTACPVRAGLASLSRLDTALDNGHGSHLPNPSQTFRKQTTFYYYFFA